VAAGVLAAIAGNLVAGPTVAPLLGLLMRGTCAVAVYAATLAVTGFFQPREIVAAREGLHRLFHGSRPDGT
jgi:hypothetical protein